MSRSLDLSKPELAEPSGIRASLAQLQRLAASRDLEGLEQACVGTISRALGATRAECLFFDVESGALWSEVHAGERGAERSAVAGLVAHAARTGTRVNAPLVSADPRWSEALDGGDGSERLLAVPVVGREQTHAVLVAWRAARHPPFGEAAEALLASFAARAAPLFDQLSLALEATEEPAIGLFRAEAVTSRAAQRHGAVLRAPRGNVWPYLALAALLACAGLLFWAAHPELRTDAVSGEASHR